MAILASATDTCDATAKQFGPPAMLSRYPVSCYEMDKAINHFSSKITTAAEMVSCRFTIDNVVASVYVGGVKQSISGDLDGWGDVKRFSFSPASNAVLAISGYEAEGGSRGCSVSGMTVLCESADKESPWHGFRTNANSWRAYGSASSTLSDELSFGWKYNNDVWRSATGTPPCESTSGYSLTDVNTAGPSKDKIWSANGAKYAWFSAAPTLTAKSTLINLVSNMLTFSKEGCADVLEAFPKYSNLLQCSEFDGKTFLTLDPQFCDPVLADMNAALQTTTTTTASSTTTTTTTITVTTTTTTTIKVADSARSGAAGTSIGVVLGVLCICGGSFLMWRRKQQHQQHQNKPARQRVKRRAAKQELERTETERNTIQMEDNPLRLSRAGTSAPAEYVNVRLPGQQVDGQDLQANVGADSDDDTAAEYSYSEGVAGRVYYSQITESAFAQQGVAAEYAVSSDAGLAADAVYSIGDDGGNGGGGRGGGALETTYSVPNDAGAIYETPDGGVMYASSA